MYQEKYDLWLNNAVGDRDLIDELKSIKDNGDEISDRFYKELEFGTAGLRGVIGAGTNRMNIYTVGKATQALADYINSVTASGKVAIAYDSRIKSTLFAKTAAAILANNGIKVFIYKELMPTPMLSFAVRELKCDAGIVITASHNPAKYNGYKAYGPDGCQLSPEASVTIMNRMKSVDYFGGIKFADFDSCLENGSVEFISDSVINKYLDIVQAHSVKDETLDLSDLKVIYTPLHGTGNKPVRAILKRIGVTDVTVVSEQELPDGNFPTAPYPNPEIRQPFEIALEYAKKNDADLLLATDPDADRVGIAVKEDGNYSLLSGNDVGVLMLDYLLSRKTINGTLAKDPIAVKTIVTTELCGQIAEKYGCKLINVLTGFKFIGEQIANLEKTNEEKRYVLGFEESYGYLPGTYVRDKDAVIASMLICEMAAYYKAKGLSLLARLNELFKEFGYYINRQKSFTFEGQSGMAKMSEIMTSLRTSPISQFGGHKVSAISDYLDSVCQNTVTDKTCTIDLPKSNVVKFEFEGGGRIIFRPSGTEPKIKLYIEVVATDRDDAEKQISAILADGEKMMNI